MQEVMQQEKVFRVGHLFSGMGGGALGFKKARGEFMGVSYRFENVAGVDVMPARAEAFQRLTGAPGVVMDLFTRRDYIAFHSAFQDAPEGMPSVLDRLLKKCTDPDGMVEHEGHRYWKYNGAWAEVVKWAAPPNDWREVDPQDMRRVFTETAPDVFFLSPPCQGFSRLLPSHSAGTWKYQALNNLVLRGIYLCILAWPEDPVPTFMFENVPGIKQRGADLLKEARKFMQAHGYAVHMSDHDAGEIGGLAQTRKRFLAIMRHEKKVPQFIYQPAPKKLQPIKNVINPLPMPGDPKGGPLHALPRLDFITWLRLSLIRPGGDWKDIPGPGQWRLVTMDGREVPAEAFDKKRAPDPAVWGRIFRAELLPGAQHYNDVRIQHSPMGSTHGAYWVQDPDKNTTTVTGDVRPGKTGSAATLADNRLSLKQAHMNDKNTQGNKYWVRPVDEPAAVVTGARLGSGAQAIADARVSLHKEYYANFLRVNDTDQTANTVAGGVGPNQGATLAADPRLGFSARDNAFVVLDPSQHAPAVPGSASVTSSNGPGAVSDVRLSQHGINFAGSPGLMGLSDPNKPSGTITGSPSVSSSNASAAISDPRIIRQAKGGTMGVWSPDEPGNTITTHTDANGDAPSLVDARMGCKPQNGVMGVLSWNGTSPTVIASLDVHAGTAAVADPGVTVHYWPKWFPEFFIVSPWNCWHRPLTDLELAALQGFDVVDEDGHPFVLDGSRKDVRQAIGNAVPPPAAEAIAHAIAPTLVVAGIAPDAFLLSPTGNHVWVIDNNQTQAQAIVQ